MSGYNPGYDIASIAPSIRTTVNRTRIAWYIRQIRIMLMRLASSGSAFGKSTSNNLETIAAFIVQSISCNRAGKKEMLNGLVEKTEIKSSMHVVVVYRWPLASLKRYLRVGQLSRWTAKEILKPKETILKLNVSGIGFVASSAAIVQDCNMLPCTTALATWVCRDQPRNGHSVAPILQQRMQSFFST
jgi:hypothetical protein